VVNGKQKKIRFLTVPAVLLQQKAGTGYQQFPQPARCGNMCTSGHSFMLNQGSETV
jgi:hypothetical protein